MLLIKRLWLLPPFAVFLVLYYLYRSSLPSVQPPGVNVRLGDRLGDRQERYPVADYVSLPTGTAQQLPKIQHDFSPETEDQRTERLERQASIKEAFLHSWKGYKKHAWRQDEIAPLSGAYRNSFGGWGASLVDTMDTLWIMGLHEEFEECVAAVKDIDFKTNTEDTINVFETTIRYLGGLLSAYDVSNSRYPALLAKAVELANILHHLRYPEPIASHKVALEEFYCRRAPASLQDDSIS